MGNTNLQSMSPSGLKVILNQLVNTMDLSNFEDGFHYFFLSRSERNVKLMSIVESMTGQRMNREDKEFLFELLKSFLNTGEVVIPELKTYNITVSESQYLSNEVVYETEVESFLTKKDLKNQGIYDYISEQDIDFFDSSNIINERTLETDYGDYFIEDIEEV